MANGIDLVEAVTSASPEAAYRKVLACDGVTWNEARACWIAAKAEDVDAVLGDERWRVRPRGEQMSSALVGTALGEVFSHLVRFADGERHRTLRPAVEQALGAFSQASVDETCRRLAPLLLAGGDLDRFLTALPVAVIASLCGVDDDRVMDVAEWTSSVTCGIAPGASEAEIAQGSEAATALRRFLIALLDGADAPPAIEAMRLALAERGVDDPDVTVANFIGFLIQSHDATAGLIGNALVRLALRPDMLRTREAISDLVADVARRDPSVHNTRRFAGESMRMEHECIEEGDAMLVALAAANLEDQERSWAFGGGAHACPGRQMAVSIAVEGVIAVCEAGLVPGALPNAVSYRPLGNVRIPVLAHSGDEGAGT